MANRLYVRNGLFTGSHPTDLNACVGVNGGPYNLIDYARGYTRATARLVEYVKVDSTWVDTDIYPLVFLARHAAELYIKHLVHLLPYLFGEEQSPKATHILLDNWTLVRGFISRGSELGDENPFDTSGELASQIDQVLNDLVEVDPKAEAFRFPWSREERRYLQDTALINVRVFGETMAKLFKIFELWDETAFRILDSRHAHEG